MSEEYEPEIVSSLYVGKGDVPGHAFPKPGDYDNRILFECDEFGAVSYEVVQSDGTCRSDELTDDDIQRLLGFLNAAVAVKDAKP